MEKFNAKAFFLRLLPLAYAVFAGWNEHTWSLAAVLIFSLVLAAMNPNERDISVSGPLVWKMKKLPRANGFLFTFGLTLFLNAAYISALHSSGRHISFKQSPIAVTLLIISPIIVALAFKYKTLEI